MIPIADPAGMTPLPWRRFLEGVYRRLGGAVDFVSFAYRAAQEAAAGGDLSGIAAVADAAYAAISLHGSFPVGVSIAGVASTGLASIGDHHRHYVLGVPPVEVSGGLAGPLTYGVAYWIFYDQASRAGGAVSYQATSTYTDAFPNHDAPNRHFVGVLTMPASSGAADTVGKSAVPPGYVAP
jgi:hypothetical protein